MYIFYKTYYKLHPHFMYTQKHMHTIVQHTRACMRVSAHMPCYNSSLIPGGGRAISQQCGPTSPPPPRSINANPCKYTRIYTYIASLIQPCTNICGCFYTDTRHTRTPIYSYMRRRPQPTQIEFDTS